MTNNPLRPELFGDAVCVTRLVPDAPAELDQFGPHLDVARAMTAMVRSEEGGQSMGLAGKWGAGKSTVIRLFRQELTRSANHKVWVFDAWAHEGDPLRRTFLESLISFLSDEGWVDRERWAKRIAELAGRRKESSQRTSPRLSSVGRALALSAVMVPLGTALFAHGLKAGVTLSRDAGPVNWALIFGVLLALCPLWVIAGEFVRKWRGHRRAVAAGLQPEPPDYNEVFAVFVQKALTETKTETLETPEPTSLEFERIFASLMDEALADPAHRLVLVVDNLDRIEAEDALKIWSTLQTFLQHRAHRQHWLTRLWVVMPFDPDAIRRLWEKESETGGPLAASFLDKSFQVLFDVPAPLVSDWREYLLSALRAAFPSHTEDEFHTIYRIVAVLRGPGNAPTPRELKIIVNQVGALHRQRQHAVPLVHMAYFVMLRRGGSKNVVADLRANLLPRESDMGLVGEGARDSLAALAFGVAPDKARQFLLEPPIIEALSNGDANTLAAIKDFVGFGEVLEDAMRQVSADWPKAEGGKLLQAVSALVEAGLLEEGEGSRAVRLQRELIRSAKRIETLTPLTSITERGLVLLAQRSRDAELTRTLFDLYANAVGSLEPPADKTSAADFVARVLPVVTGLEDAGLDPEQTDGIPVPGSVEACVNVYRALEAGEYAASDAARHVFRPMTTDVKVVSQFEQFIRQGQFRTEHRRVLRAAVAHSPELDWGTVFSAARERLGGGNSIQPAELVSVLGALTDQRHITAAERPLRTLVTEGSIAHHVHSISGQRDVEPLATCVFTQLLVTPGLTAGGQIGNSVAGYSLLRTHAASPPEGLPEALGELLYKAGREDGLLALLDAMPDARPLVAETLGVLVARNDLDAFFTPEMLHERWPALDGYIDPEALLAKPNDDAGVMELAQEAGFQHDRATLYAALLRRGPNAVAFRAWCAEGLRSISSDEWLAELHASGQLIQLGLVCREQGDPVELKEPFRSAVQMFAGQIARSERGVPEVESWPAVFDLLEPHQREVMLQQVYEVLQDHARLVGAPFFQVFGAELAAAGLLNGDRSAFTKILEPLLASRNTYGLRWVRGQLSSGDSALKGITQAHRKVFTRQLADELRDGADDEAHEEVKAIAAALGVRPAKVRSPKEGDASDA